MGSTSENANIYHQLFLNAKINLYLTFLGWNITTTSIFTRFVWIDYWSIKDLNDNYFNLHHSIITNSINIQNINIYFTCLGCLYGLFVVHIRENCWTDRTQFFGGTSHEPRRSFWTSGILKICHQKPFFLGFHKKKHHEKIFYNLRTFCFTVL